VEFIDSL
jgi:hypothetical protein